jgi:hypothetical protein
MSYIIKTTSGLLNTRITDAGRKAISQGNFNISYFQVGDSEIDYRFDLPIKLNILMPSYNAENNNGYNSSNKHNIKYPYYLGNTSGTTYGIPFNDANPQEFYNIATSKGFFISGATQFQFQTSSLYTLSANFKTKLSDSYGQSSILVEKDNCTNSNTIPKENDFITINYNQNASCGTLANNYPVLTYKILYVSPIGGGTKYILDLDRSIQAYSSFGQSAGEARCYIYPSGMTEVYDSYTPEPNWFNDVFNFETICDTSAKDDTRVWNMNIPWTETVAGIVDDLYGNYADYGSYNYIGTKEYLGYTTNSGQIISDTNGDIYFYNSKLEKQINNSSDQKAIAIVHYTNQSIDNVYGEKFMTKPFDPEDATMVNSAKDFKISIPTLMWHKSTTSKIGETFYIDPPSQVGLCVPYFIYSGKNDDMNNPGIRFYNLWDNNKNANGKLNRVGRVFPDSHLIVFDDDEIVAALSYKSNRNWTLPAPSLSLISPNVCDNDSTNDVGFLTGNSETLWVTYRFNSTTKFTNSLHCNYYEKIEGPSIDCFNINQNVAIKFGDEFKFLKQNSFTGFNANEFNILCQKVKTGERPETNKWRRIDFTSQLNATKVNGFITSGGLLTSTFIVTKSLYDSAEIYDLTNYIKLPLKIENNGLNFGDEYFFYGNIETGIVATIYEMKYLVNLVDTQFKTTTNPTYVSGKDKYISEIGLYNSDKELMVISKLLQPIKRQGVQQYNVSLDF